MLLFSGPGILKATTPSHWTPPYSTRILETERIPLPGCRPTWIEVDLSALDHNLSVLKACLPPACSVMAVVKDNAYGHGLAAMARHLQGRVQMMGVAILEEAVLLRDSGITCPILVLNGLFEGQEKQAVGLEVMTVVSDAGALSRLAAAARSVGMRACYHLKVDTGMNRLGLPPDEIPAFMEQAACLRQIECGGLMSHLACADHLDSDLTEHQLLQFRQCLDAVKRYHPVLPWVHVANSSGILNCPDSHFNLVRPGIALYGYRRPGREDPDTLRPILTLKSRIVSVKGVPEGSSVGYGATFRARRRLRLATVPIGYGDGFYQQWSNSAWVLVSGERVPLVGRVNMDLITLDITECPAAQEGTEVVLLGKSGSEMIDADDMARRLGTTAYEVLTSLRSRIPRVYFE